MTKTLASYKILLVFGILFVILNQICYVNPIESDAGEKPSFKSSILKSLLGSKDGGKNAFLTYIFSKFGTGLTYDQVRKILKSFSSTKQL